MSFATPGEQHPELVLDMAQSMTSRGRIKLAMETGQTIPESWAIDKEGNPTTDPKEALSGAVLPSGGHKGSAMSLMVEMLASGLTGAHLSQEIHHAGFTSRRQEGPAGAEIDVTVGNSYIVIDSSVFGEEQEVRKRSTRIAEYVRASKPVPGVASVLAPGDVELAKRRETDAHGITLSAHVFETLHDIAAERNVPMPAFAG